MPEYDLVVEDTDETPHCYSFESFDYDGDDGEDDEPEASDA